MHSSRGSEKWIDRVILVAELLIIFDLDGIMKVEIIDRVFGIDGLGKVVEEYFAPEKKERVSVATIAEAYYKAKHEEGLSHLFQQSLSQLPRYNEERRRMQLAEGAFCALKIWRAIPQKGHSEAYRMAEVESELLRKKAEGYEAIYRRLFLGEGRQTSEKLILFSQQEKREVAQAQDWLMKQSMSLEELTLLAESDAAIKTQNEMVKGFYEEYVKVNQLTKKDAETIFADKTLHGKPFDQNRLGKVGIRKVKTSDGQKMCHDLCVPGFDSFYVAGSVIEMPLRRYAIMQAPLAVHGKKVDTVRDFWESVVLLCQSPIIVSTHDPEEKLAKRGYMERARYWAQELFPMPLRDGWKLERCEGEELLVTSRHDEKIRLVKRSFLATKEGHVRHVTQFHYQGWPDHLAAPDHELLEEAHKAVQKEFEVRRLAPHSIVTVHCAAGMGRSPCFAVSDYVRLELQTKIQAGEKLDTIRLNVPAIIYAFKKQRPSMLGGQDHWQSIYYSLRRAYQRYKGVSTHEIRALEQQRELNTIAKGQKMQEDDRAKNSYKPV